MFALSPRPFWGWRCILLRVFGASVGHNVHIYPSVRISMPWNLEIGDESAIGDRAVVYSLGPITIGKQVTVSQQVHLCAGTHDHRHPGFPLVKSPIRVENEAWICADAFIGPGVTVGAGAIVGARGVAMDDVSPATIVAGNPARFLRRRTELSE